MKYSDLIKDIRVRYRNTFDDAQLLVWLNESMNEIYQTIELDSIPYLVQTIYHEHFYNLPPNMDVTKIKTVTGRINNSDAYIEIPFVRVDDMQFSSPETHWYSIVGQMFYINVPGEILDNTPFLIFCDAFVDDVTTDQIEDIVQLPAKYHEILKLGVLERIAAARKDVTMKGNYSADKQEKIDDFAWQTKLAEPEWTKPIDAMPYRPGSYGRRCW